MLTRAALVLGVTLMVFLSAATGVAAAAVGPREQATPTWSMPTNGDLLSAFDRNSYNEQDGTPAQVASTAFPGQQALRFTLDGGDVRSEVQPPIRGQREGQVEYYSYRASLAPDFPVDVSTFQLIFQWHQMAGSGSPPVGVEVRDGSLVLACEGKYYMNLGPVSGGQPIDLVLRIDFSRDPEVGTVDVWNHGAHVLTGYHPPGGTLLDESNYMKLGLYRDESIERTSTITVDEVKAGPTMADVSPGLVDAEAPDSAGPAHPPTSSLRPGSSALWAAGGMLVVVLVGVLVVVRTRRTG